MLKFGAGRFDFLAPTPTMIRNPGIRSTGAHELDWSLP